MEVKIHGKNSCLVENGDSTLYRIDKDEFSNGMATVRNNLIRIMEKDLFKAKELRELIVDLKPPIFKHTSTAYNLSGPASQAQINVDQRDAIEKVMCAKDYALVLGMPGTGKTTTIAHIIRALVSQGKSVLLTSYTHTAVDNILLKIEDDAVPILRLGSVGKVHPDIPSFATLSGIPCKTMPELERSWRDSKVVATTCLGINHGIFNHRIFDYCIVDEASQITLPVCLGPIRLAHTFVLVGDHYQLPPLVQNKEAQEGGLDVSLFKLLSDKHPQAVVNLEHQYRMAEDVMLLSNRLIYSGRLKCGTPAVAQRMLEVSNAEAAMEAHHHRTSTITSQHCASADQTCFLRQALTPSRRVFFLNTDTITHPTSSVEVMQGQRITNPTESLLTAQLLTTLIRSGVPARSIGVITFYRSQLALLRHDVKAIAGTIAASEVEMHTADKYQGRDKEVILLSCVRSNESNSPGYAHNANAEGQEMDGNTILKINTQPSNYSQLVKHARLPAYKAPKKLVKGQVKVSSDNASSVLASNPITHDIMNDMDMRMDTSNGKENKYATAAVTKKVKSQDISAFNSDEFFGDEDDEMLIDF
ncbi:DNA replication endonuclease-helicase Dna2 [Elasticomyces elasticus]|nr:DNA replication endonuclease-helicase Dna2 [Elasticomyces elasticus]